MLCTICHKTLDNPLDVLSTNCGGDCILCMAECSDPDAIAVVRRAVAEKQPVLDTETDRIQHVLHVDKPTAPEYSADRHQRIMGRYD